jgi:phosphatidate phosphatase APP1
MAELYRDLDARGARFHFVSSSPWQLYTPLRDFLLDAGFPWATLDLKSIRFRDETLFNLFKKGTETKPEQIIPILQRYPDRKFILIGDSGEQDPEVYGDIARRFPGSIQHILIRSLGREGRDDARYQDAFKAVPSHKWQLFDNPGQLSASELIVH